MAAPFVEYNGARWHLAQDGYYRNSRRGLLHRAIWADSNGPIPDGHHIHHRDHDRSNNDPANLIALDPATHWADHGDERGADWHSKGGRASWADRPMVKQPCVVCGTVFESRATRRFYCGARCRDRGSRAIAVRVCCVCGDEFTTEARRSARTCSPPCRAQAAAATRTGL